MALSESIAAYTDCLDLYDRAQADGKGVRVLVENQNAAYILRLRLNHARVLERRESMRLYERTDPKYGKSANDRFRVTMREAAEGETGFWVYIEEWAQDHLAIEGLSSEDRIDT